MALKGELMNTNVIGVEIKMSLICGSILPLENEIEVIWLKWSLPYCNNPYNEWVVFVTMKVYCTLSPFCN